MPPKLREKFKSILLGLPKWQSEAKRHDWVQRVLSHHRITDQFRPEGSREEAAADLLDLSREHGLGPFLLLLRDLLHDASLAASRRTEIEQLAAELERADEAKRGLWGSGSPYLGLRTFEPKHAPLYFGRDKEVEALLDTLATAAAPPPDGCGFTVLVGASGAGKSSLVRAGVWARLAAGRAAKQFPGSERWLISAMRPNAMTTFDASLQAALSQAIEGLADVKKKRRAVETMGSTTPLADVAEQLLPADARWLLILDQMEELFTADKRKDERRAFLDRLLEGVRPAKGNQTSRLLVLATIRSDFYHHCLEAHERLADAFTGAGGKFELLAPRRLALEKMVSGPHDDIELAEPFEIDPALPSTIAADAESQPGGLALMAFGLEKLYELCKKKHRRMDLETYHGPEFGGLAGAIARHADATLCDLGEGGEATLQRVFANLVRTRPDEPPTRTRMARSAWADGTPEKTLVDRFVEENLLVSDHGMIEVAHETLLREWPKLANWIEERREAFWLADRVRAQARDWKDDDGDRPWTAATVEAYRKQLKDAELLDHLCGQDPKITRLLMPEAAWLVDVELERPSTTHMRRWQIGVRLNEMGDERDGVRLVNGLPKILWRKIPGGEVEVEKVGRRRVAPFEMVAFAITFGQFRAFLSAKDGFDSKKWWTGLKKESRDSAWAEGLANHPVTGVSWYDAMAFCRWLRTIEKGRDVRLPDEAEWQWAAQSARADFAYPWGAEWEEGRANTFESGPRRVTAVGMYPGGKSLQEVWDLAGNVREWCENKHSEEGEPRVLRGGSWNNLLDVARAAYRGEGPPDDRRYAVGFRVVCSSPSAEH